MVSYVDLVEVPDDLPCPSGALGAGIRTDLAMAEG
jgi:hypothetical protein